MDGIKLVLGNGPESSTVALWEAADGILFKLEYNCDLFKASSMQLFAERCVSLIMQVIKQPDILLNDIIMDSMLLQDEAETMPYAGDSFNFEYPLGNS